jgi:hypothetical protein
MKRLKEADVLTKVFEHIKSHMCTHMRFDYIREKLMNFDLY